MGSGDFGTTVQSDTNQPEPNDQFLAHVTKQSPLPPGELKRVMSDKLAVQKATPHKQEANKSEITIDGIKYYRASMHDITYSSIEH